MVIVDTSVLIDYLRGEKLIELEALILNGQALLSKVVKLELLCGVRKKELPHLELLFGGLTELDSFAQPLLCEKFLQLARWRGLLGGVPDLMILGDTAQNKARLYSLDQNQKKLAVELRIPLFEPG